jgi:protein gp37
MTENSSISWTDASFVPWFGCADVSDGCDFCYAESWTLRYRKAGWGPHTGRVRSAPSTWRDPLRWNRKAAAQGRRRTVFTSELSDVFDNKAPQEWRDDLWQLMRETPHLLWLALTKRPQNAAKMLPADWPLANAWLGVTAENQTEADRRMPILASLPAVGRFVSAEPLLGPVDLRPWLGGIDFVIAGCESRGARAGRPTDPAWVRSLRDQCVGAGVAFHLKQLAGPDGRIVHVPTLDGQRWSAMPIQ